MPLLRGSPAIDAIPADAVAVGADQRGAPRPAPVSEGEASGDIGAFELQPREAYDTAAVPWRLSRGSRRRSRWRPRLRGRADREESARRIGIAGAAAA